MLAVLGGAGTAAADDEPAFDAAALSSMSRTCATAGTDCDPVALLSKLERRAVDRAMRDRGLAFDRTPAGKRIGRIHVATLPVFGDQDGFLRWLNHFHVTSTEETVRRDLAFAVGGSWDQRQIDETARRLRDPISTALVAIVPVQAVAPDEVDVLVVTRDVWSLRTNSNYELQGGQLTLLDISISENNLAGTHKLLAANFRMDQATYSVGPIFIDRNMLGRHLELVGRVGPLFNRSSNSLEGSESAIRFGRPLWSLDTKWAASVEWQHRFAIERKFQGAELLTYDAPETPGDDALPYEYHSRRTSLTGKVTRAWGERIEQRVSGGYQLATQRARLLPDFPDDPVLEESFTREVLPPTERTSVLFVGYEMFESRYRNFQNVDSYELAEDVQMGARVSATIGMGLTLFGNTSFLRLSGEASYAGGFGHDGLWRVALAGTTRLQDDDAIDEVVEGKLRLVTPTFGFGRLVSGLEVAGIFHDTQNQSFAIGGDTGLRAFPIGAFTDGERRLRWQTELRTLSVPVLFTRWGMVFFHDAGGVGASFRSMPVYQDAGVGVRILIPQGQPQVLRFDVATILDGPGLGGARLTAGYFQSF